MTKIVLIAALGAIASVSAAGPAAVELGTAGCYTILSSLAISNLPDGSGLTSAIKGNMGVSTISSVGEITGFSLTDDSTKTFATSLLVEGRVYDADYAAPTPTLLTVAVGAMGIAYTDAAERPPPYYEEEDDDTDVPADNFGRDSRPVPGLFKYLSSVNITGDFTISGSPTDTWIFLITRDLIVAKNVQITLVDGRRLGIQHLLASRWPRGCRNWRPHGRNPSRQVFCGLPEWFQPEWPDPVAGDCQSSKCYCTECV
ncbi:unnamed protein product [Polarella glacialis]|uniref:Uncharacterized protein n=1 Tax=Polarella glacialis TaxID=89957 RepID=A0A813FYH3_POLGL|nr:unnamed protein product [Polarella glacialis]CAE8615656.1 unnamed protein product [Polarella glacialis]CAE8649923.1 unnamed protein product [Polarella glacialis]